MRAALIIVGVLVLLTGGVFAGQGLGYIPGSFMTGDRHWFWIGSGLIIIGVLVIVAMFSVARRQSRA